MSDIGWLEFEDETEDDGSPKYRRVMSPEQVKERIDLQVAVTTQALRERVQQENAKSNGRH